MGPGVFQLPTTFHKPWGLIGLELGGCMRTEVCGLVVRQPEDPYSPPRRSLTLNPNRHSEHPPRSHANLSGTGDALSISHR